MMITIMQVTTLSQRLIDLSQLPPTHGATFWEHLNQIYLCMWNGADNLCLVTGITPIPRTGEQSKKIMYARHHCLSQDIVVWSITMDTIGTLYWNQWRIQSWSQGGGGFPSDKLKWLVKVGASKCVIRVDLKKIMAGRRFPGNQKKTLDTPLGMDTTCLYNQLLAVYLGGSPVSTDNFVPLLCVTSNVIITYHCCAAETQKNADLHVIT